MTTAIKFENVSKQYRLGEVGSGTLADDFHRMWAKLRGKPDPLAKVGQVNDREARLETPNGKGIRSRLASLGGGQASADYVWALQDIDFEVKEGEILGIIGRNGAGKSTLLKLLSRVTAPTTGSIKAKGRIASLLEVGTGFHPELTGRENIYLNGAILGMRRHEITKQLDAIIDFSGCGKYIDTPVKRYSSGMTVRLGFSVAAHLDCEILVVDEVLAVGDAEFQKKCIGKMQTISNESGKTVLFVSHNMSSVEQLCQRGIMLERGRISFIGGVAEAVNQYLANKDASSNDDLLLGESNRSGNGIARFRSVTFQDERGKEVTSLRCGEKVTIKFQIDNTIDCTIPNASVGYSISTPRGESLVVAYSDYEDQLFELVPGENLVEVTTGPLTFRSGIYQLGCRLLAESTEVDWPKFAVGTLVVDGGNIGGSARQPHSGRGLFMIDNDWQISSVSNLQ